MTIHVFYVDHRDGLECVAHLAATTSGLGTTLRALPSVRGAMVLHTCNRLALYLDHDDQRGAAGGSQNPYRCDEHVHSGGSATSAVRQVPNELAPAVAGILGTEATTLHHRSGVEALRHLFATTAGLESMVIGEREIAGQVRRAATLAAQEGTLSCDLGRAVDHASACSRRIARNTTLASLGRSVVGVGLEISLQHMGRTTLNPHDRILVVGTGAYAGATVTHLREMGAQRISVYSQSQRAERFAQGRGLSVICEDELIPALAASDLVVTCRGLGQPIITRDLTTQGLSIRPQSQGPLHILDLALRPDTAADVVGMHHVDYVGLADIQRFIGPVRRDDISQAQALLEEGLDAFLQDLSARQADPVVIAIRDYVAAVVEEERQSLAAHAVSPPGQDAPMIALHDADRALRRIAGRLLHHPTVLAKQAGREGYIDDYMRALKLVMGIDIDNAHSQPTPGSVPHFHERDDCTIHAVTQMKAGR
ncbi:hypothetical protein [Actinomyces vulturis]|uniref:hypothetical protein n=1 Tax=Actinomyces vulturis TaxID=1857645 RepID=UPI00082E6BE0|nr:hypothetical protein [Actinomyces vulturis]